MWMADGSRVFVRKLCDPTPGAKIFPAKNLPEARA